MSGHNLLPHRTNPRSEIRGHRSVLNVRGKPVFRLIPSRLELFPGSSCEMTLTGSSDTSKVRRFDTLQILGLSDICKPGILLSSQVVHERLVCRTIVDGHSSYEHIHSVDVTCTFMSSLLSIFPEKMNFYIEKVGKNCRRHRDAGLLARRSHLKCLVFLLFHCSPGLGPESKSRV